MRIGTSTRLAARRAQTYAALLHNRPAERRLRPSRRCRGGWPSNIARGSPWSASQEQGGIRVPPKIRCRVSRLCCQINSSLEGSPGDSLDLRILPLPAPTPRMSMRTCADGTMTAPGGVAGEQTRIPRFGQTGTLSFLNTVGKFTSPSALPAAAIPPPLASSPAAALVETPPMPPVRDGCGRLSPTTCRAPTDPCNPTSC